MQSIPSSTIEAFMAALYTAFDIRLPSSLRGGIPSPNLIELATNSFKKLIWCSKILHQSPSYDLSSRGIGTPRENTFFTTSVSQAVSDSPHTTIWVFFMIASIFSIVSNFILVPPIEHALAS